MLQDFLIFYWLQVNLNTAATKFKKFKNQEQIIPWTQQKTRQVTSMDHKIFRKREQHFSEILKM